MFFIVFWFIQSRPSFSLIYTCLYKNFSWKESGKHLTLVARCDRHKVWLKVLLGEQSSWLSYVITLKNWLELLRNFNPGELFQTLLSDRTIHSRKTVSDAFEFQSLSLKLRAWPSHGDELAIQRIAFNVSQFDRWQVSGGSVFNW